VTHRDTECPSPHGHAVAWAHKWSPSSEWSTFVAVTCVGHIITCSYGPDGEGLWMLQNLDGAGAACDTALRLHHDHASDGPRPLTAPPVILPLDTPVSNGCTADDLRAATVGLRVALGLLEIIHLGSH